VYNSEIPVVSLIGSGTFDLFVSNSIDTAPTKGSTNLITSGGVAEALDGFTADGVSQEDFEDLSAAVDAEISAREAAIAEIKSQGIQQTPLFANGIEECTDTTKVYVFPDGYIYGYKSTKEIVKHYTDLANNFEDGGLNSSGNVATSGWKGVVCTDYIPFTKGTVVRVKGFGAMLDNFCAQYNASKAAYSTSRINVSTSINDYDYDEETGIVTVTCITSGVAYLRVSGIPTGTTDDVIITVNEEISEEVVTTYEWANTGHAFVPADYEARIIALEQKLANL
jgi:hypothetical protein